MKHLPLLVTGIKTMPWQKIQGKLSTRSSHWDITNPQSNQ